MCSHVLENVGNEIINIMVIIFHYFTDILKITIAIWAANQLKISRK
jgi:hypothetical protein